MINSSCSWVVPCATFERKDAASVRSAIKTFSSAMQSRIRSDEGLTLETSAFESLYGGQFTLSTQLMKPVILLYFPPTQHHSFVRNLPLYSYAEYRTAMLSYSFFVDPAGIQSDLLVRQLIHFSSIWTAFFSFLICVLLYCFFRRIFWGFRLRGFVIVRSLILLHQNCNFWLFLTLDSINVSD